MTGGPVTFTPATLGEPVLRWRSRARSIEGIEQELSRIWTSPDMNRDLDGDKITDVRVAARTSVMNLVVIARRQEIGERCASTIQRLTGRHPSRTTILSSADPDGPSWLDAQIQAHCVLPRQDAAATCAETIYVTAGGEGGRHLDAIVAPLLIHDLPVTVWWPDEPPFGSQPANDLFEMADRLIVDGSGWRGTGLEQLRRMAALQERLPLAISDFALVRQSRWRETIASIFDIPNFLRLARLASRHARDEAADTAHGTRPPRTDQTGRGRAAGDGRPRVGSNPSRRSDGRGRGRPAGAFGDAARDDAADRAPGRLAELRASGRRDRGTGGCSRSHLAGRRARP